MTGLDVETTTKCKGHPFERDNFLVSYVLSDSNGYTFQYYTDPSFRSTLHKAINKADALVGFHIKFDLHWCSNQGVHVPLTTKVWDVSLAEFVLSGQSKAFASLNDTLDSYSLPQKIDRVKEYWDAGIDTPDIPVAVLAEYNIYDVQGNNTVAQAQWSIMPPKLQNLVWLMGEDLKALQHAEFNGIKFDEVKAKNIYETYKTSLEGISNKLSKFLPAIQHGTFNWDSGDHLSALLYGGVINFDYSISEDAIYKSGLHKGQAYVRNRWHVETCVFPRRFNPIAGTEVKKSVENKDPNKTPFYQVDAPTLAQLKTRSKENKALLSLLTERANKIKIVEMIESIQKVMTARGWNDGYLHPQFNQNVVVTGRLSSSSPNMQNTPPEIDELLVSRYDS